MTRRALIRLDELRRMARVARDEGVTFQGQIDPLGKFCFTIAPVSTPLAESGDELDAAMDRFLGK